MLHKVRHLFGSIIGHHSFIFKMNGSYKISSDKISSEYMGATPKSRVNS